VVYAQVNVANLDEVYAAIAIFGTLHLGVDLHLAQQAQTDAGGPWDYVASSGDWGGHAVLGGFYTSDTTAGRPDVSVITWGKPLGTTDAFWKNQAQEAWVVIWPEHLSQQSFLAGVDQAKLAADYQALTNQPLPVPPSPAPVPPGPIPVPPGPVPPAPGGLITPGQVTANANLASAAHQYIRAPHVWAQNTRMATQLTSWLKTWGL
jgi:hypothetical protein